MERRRGGGGKKKKNLAKQEEEDMRRRQIEYVCGRVTPFCFSPGEIFFFPFYFHFPIEPICFLHPVFFTINRKSFFPSPCHVTAQDLALYPSSQCHVTIPSCDFENIKFFLLLPSLILLFLSHKNVMQEFPNTRVT